MNRRQVIAGVTGAGFAARPVPLSAGRQPAGQEPGPVSFVVELDVAEGKVAEFLALLHPVLDAMRHEPTFINAVLHCDAENPNHFMIYETWSDLDDVVAVQLHRPYRKPYLERLPDLLSAERRISIWNPIRSEL